MAIYLLEHLERANKGTLLIDEVSEIHIRTQSNILRVLIDQKFKRLNGSKDGNVNIRLISSTSKNLNDLVKINKFREDLYHRLNDTLLNSTHSILGQKISRCWLIILKKSQKLMVFSYKI